MQIFSSQFCNKNLNKKILRFVNFAQNRTLHSEKKGNKKNFNINHFNYAEMKYVVVLHIF